MITLYDYLPSQNAWKVRALLHHLGIAYKTELVSIFTGEGRRPEYLRINPWGAVPAIKLDDGRVLSESNAILWYLSEGTKYRPSDAFDAAKVMQWLSFESDYVQNSIGSLQYWALTGKMDARDPAVVEGKREIANRALSILNSEFETKPFICGKTYTIADISLFAYAHRAGHAGFDTGALPAFEDWQSRVCAQDGFLAEMHFYSVDENAIKELPS
jgi:glutathione S-transferase